MPPVIHRPGDAEAWEALAAAGRGRQGILVLKFSPICPISAAAEEEFDAWTAGLAGEPGFAIAKVDVIGARPLSRCLAEVLGVRHESPQVLWLGPDLSVRWHASHGDITRESLRASVR